MDRDTDETPPLLMLNDKCLLDIFQLLELNDFVHFAETCVRLRNVARLNKFKRINVSVLDTNDTVSKEEFIKIMSVIGEHVLTAHVSHGSNDVFDIIRDNCKKLNLLGSSNCAEPVQLHGFKKLKGLQLLDTEHNFLPDINNEIVSLSMTGNQDFRYAEERQYFLELLKRLPKLKNLNMGCEKNIYYLHSREFLSHTNGLTSFSFRSGANMNDFLKKLSHLNLVELRFKMTFNAATFDILQQFQNLEVLMLVHHFQAIKFPETTVLPPKLTHLKMNNIDISWSKLSSIVEKCERLQVFDLGSNGCILFDDNGSKHFPNVVQANLKLITPIEKHLTKQRALTIMYYSLNVDQQSCVYASNNLKVINTYKQKLSQELKRKTENIFLKL